MCLINFDNVAALNELLEHIGITTELGEFLLKHLTQVLRKQHRDVVIESIELIRTGGCSVDGKQVSQGPIISVDSLCIPIDTHVVLLSNNRTHELDLRVSIIAKASDGAFDLTTDVIVQRQWSS